MPLRVHVESSLIEWASERSGKTLEDLSAKFPRVGAWAQGEAEPTLKQLEAFAKATSTPIGFLMLPEPPELPLPIPDFRTIAAADRRPPSADLLDTIYLCKERQEWYRRYSLMQGEAPLDFVGSVNLGDDVTATAARMREQLAFDLESRREYGSWTEALGKLSERAEDVGVLVMISGVVASNTRRVLDPEEFRGFALVDDRAPVVFVNGTDTKAAQIFTLAHELAHVWLGQPTLSNPRHDIRRDDQQGERFCNAVAAELLVPASHVNSEFDAVGPIHDELQRLARLYRVSTLVVLRQIHELGRLSWDAYRAAYSEELRRVSTSAGSSGGNFYNTQPVRTSKRFAHAVIADALEGRTLHRDAFRLLGGAQVRDVPRAGAQVGASVTYLLDANVFIQAKNLQYGFDFCPAFWDWLDERAAESRVASIEKVLDELKAGGDDLTTWATARAE